MDARTGQGEGHAAAAEEVRSHLVCLRGGGLFLSSADALLLVQWLDAGVSVPRILRALERAAEARRARRSRFPLQLTHAKRHLDRPTKGAFGGAVRQVPGPALAPVVVGLDGSAPSELALRGALEALQGTDPEALFREAATAVRGFLEARWHELPASARATLEAEARDDLGDLADGLDEDTLEALVAEGARDRLRAGYPALSAASLWEVVEARADEG